MSRPCAAMMPTVGVRQDRTDTHRDNPLARTHSVLTELWLPSSRVTTRLTAPATTWSLIKMVPSALTIKPDPSVTGAWHDY